MYHNTAYDALLDAEKKGLTLTQVYEMHRPRWTRSTLANLASKAKIRLAPPTRNKNPFGYSMDDLAKFITEPNPLSARDLSEKTGVKQSTIKTMAMRLRVKLPRAAHRKMKDTLRVSRPLRVAAALLKDHSRAEQGGFVKIAEEFSCSREFVSQIACYLRSEGLLPSPCQTSTPIQLAS